MLVRPYFSQLCSTFCLCILCPQDKREICTFVILVNFGKNVSRRKFFIKEQTIRIYSIPTYLHRPSRGVCAIWLWQFVTFFKKSGLQPETDETRFLKLRLRLRLLKSLIRDRDWDWDSGSSRYETETETETLECPYSRPRLRLRLWKPLIRDRDWDWDLKVSRDSRLFETFTT